MFSKPLAFVVLALACLTAAAGGAYIATRHNMSDAAAVSTGSGASALAPHAGQPVAETEAAVTPKVEAAPEQVRAEAPMVVTSRPIAKAAPKPDAKVTHDPTPAPAPVVKRTVPITNPGTPVSQSDPAPAAPAPPAAAPAPKPAEALKPVEEAPPEPVHVPQFEELILPASAVIGLQVETSTSSERARVEDRVDARVSRDVMAAGRVAIPAGSRVIGTVTTVERGGKVKETARLGIRFHTLVLADGTQVPLQTDPVYRLGEPPAAASSKKIGGAAVGGAILGAILGGGKGAAIGGATGAATGTAAVMAGDRNAATLRQGEYLNVKLASPATITVERHEQ